MIWPSKNNTDTLISRFITADRNTDYLLPPSLSEWLPEGHLASFVADIVGHST
jgi:hypothetical protein